MTYTPDTLLTFDGVEQPIREHALDFGIPSSRIITRLAAGWSVENAIGRPILVEQDATPRIPGTGAPATMRGRPSRLYSAAGESLTLAEWAERSGINKKTLESRLHAGETLAEAITQLPRAGRRYTHKGESRTLSEWAEHLGIAKHMLRTRVQRGMPISQALTTPVETALTYKFQGRMMTVTELAAHAGLKPATLYKRLRNMSVEDAVKRPLSRRGKR